MGGSPVPLEPPLSMPLEHSPRYACGTSLYMSPYNLPLCIPPENRLTRSISLSVRNLELDGLPVLYKPRNFEVFLKHDSFYSALSTSGTHSGRRNVFSMSTSNEATLHKTWWTKTLLH